jgi:hypothetical protein
MKEMPMKEMSLQQAKEFWTYLHSQAELKLQAFIAVPYGSSYKDEKRAEAETYQQLAKRFSEYFEQSIVSAEDIHSGLMEVQVAGFLDSLGEQIIELKAALERTQGKKQEALDSAQAAEYSRVKSIYKDMENLEKCQINVIEDSRKSFMNILMEG